MKNTPFPLNEKDVKIGGSLFFEENNIINPPIRKDISIHRIPAIEAAG